MNGIVERRELGTRVEVMAVAWGEGKIRLELRPSVSEPDSANSVPGNPAIKVRWIDTGVELKSGQTIVVSGMVQSRVEASNVGTPRPVGALFYALVLPYSRLRK
jgi:pilus assembly protein CpaC